MGGEVEPIYSAVSFPTEDSAVQSTRVRIAGSVALANGKSSRHFTRVPLSCMRIGSPLGMVPKIGYH